MHYVSRALGPVCSESWRQETTGSPAGREGILKRVYMGCRKKGGYLGLAVSSMWGCDQEE